MARWGRGAERERSSHRAPIRTATSGAHPKMVLRLTVGVGRQTPARMEVKSIPFSGMRARGTEETGQRWGNLWSGDCCPAERARVPAGVHAAWCRGKPGVRAG